VTGLRAGRLQNRCLVSCSGQQCFIFCSLHANSGVQPVCIECNVCCFLSQNQAVGSCSRPLSCTQCLVSSLKSHGNKPPLLVYPYRYSMKHLNYFILVLGKCTSLPADTERDPVLNTLLFETQ